MKSIISEIGYSKYLTTRILEMMLEDKGIEGLSSSHGSIIFNLFKYERLPMKDLAQLIRRDKSTMTVLVKKLEKLGYISRLDNLEDKRSKYIILTDEGKKLKDDFFLISDEILKTIWSGFEEDEITLFCKMLKKINNNLEVRIEDE